MSLIIVASNRLLVCGLFVAYLWLIVAFLWLIMVRNGENKSEIERGEVLKAFVYRD